MLDNKNNSGTVDMSEIAIDRLRKLRERARHLLDNVSTDLEAFKHQDGLTFLRKPDSESREGDVNVTTTCSCVMALAMTGAFRDFYRANDGEGAERAVARRICQKIVDAPWMSSGVMSNNAFTTSLVIRTFGFLVDYGLLDVAACNDFEKEWDFGLQLKSNTTLPKLIQDHNDDVSEFLYQSISDETRMLLRDTSVEHLSTDVEVRRSLTRDLQHIIHNGGWIYTEERFHTASIEIDEQRRHPDTYKLVQFNQRLLQERYIDDVEKSSPKSLTQVAGELTSGNHASNFRINDYAASAPVVYWFVDGISRASITLDDDGWQMLCTWASDEFSRQRSLVLANHDAMMDPVALGMAASLCARLRTLVENRVIKGKFSVPATLPSAIELQHSIEELFRHQLDSGIWPKYFPMFHYQEAGSNFCFTFELLEAVLREFSAPTYQLLSSRAIVKGLERAVTWCEGRLSTTHENNVYCGWNSGGDLKTLKREQPESWATAVVHMFLRELDDVLSAYIQGRILRKYDARLATRGGSSKEKLESILDIDICIQGTTQSLKNDILKTVVEANADLNENAARGRGVRPPMSALPFGPPGTSKTFLTEALAEALGWPLIIINPSKFVENSMAEIYIKADEIFQDLKDLAGAVVFFDEMDPMMQSREGGGLDTATQFLTVSMLPRLTELHDRRRVVYVMATNHRLSFDPALTRAGRFDLLLCMGPPTYAEKIRGLPAMLNGEKHSSETVSKLKAAFELLAPADSHTWEYWQLELYTYAEFRTFVNRVVTLLDSGEPSMEPNKEKLIKLLKEDSKYVGLRLDDLPKDLHSSFHGTFKLYDLVKDPNPPEKDQWTPVVRYLLDRRESKRQY